MYPLDVFNLFPPFPRNDNVFVAMSFDKKFNNRWENVIEPAIREVGLNPFRIDKRTISDSIVTEIVSGIANCRLFFADVTAFGKYDDRPLRNENVLYEVGIAHSHRLAEEVILFRSDNYNLMFDLANIRVNPYDPDGKPEEAKKLIKEALNSALDEIVLQKHFSVQRVVDSLSFDCIQLILDTSIKGNKLRLYSASSTYASGYMAMRSNSVHYLMDLGVLSITYPKLESGVLKTEGEKWKYAFTPFGKEVAKLVAIKYGLKCDFEITAI